MRRIVRLLPGSQMAAGIAAVCRLDAQRIVVIDVTLRAGRDFPRRGHLVRVCQREASTVVIKRRIRPARGVVTGRALGHGETRRNVVRDISAESLRAVPLRQVTAGIPAIRWCDLQRVVVTDMALRARRGDVRTSQGESRHGMVEGRHVHPGNGVVALCAVRCPKRGAGG
jgi:hypothetical protein